MRSLPNVEELDTVPLAELPAVLAELLAIAARGALRLRTVAAPPEPATDVYLTAKQAAELTGRSLRWIRAHGHTLPGFSQPHGRGTAARWSRAALLAWANGGRP